MTKTFRDEETGKRWRERDVYHNGTYHIEPIPTPPQTETDILVEMHKAIQGAPWRDQYEKNRMLQLADAIVEACGKIGEMRKRAK